ncbi:hypothetical protein CCMA1212_007549 [Trichoderma ghanense]|uniref:Uncharacterized protein n=1 Tax=Trichoderma ghanense TaxID=65468 RepID=A0ABY2GY17_9HYPO
MSAFIVRSDDQARRFGKLSVNAFQSLLLDQDKITSIKALIVIIAIHCESSVELNLAVPLILALQKRRKATGKETFFIHVRYVILILSYGTDCESRCSLQSDSRNGSLQQREGRPHRPVKDTDLFFELRNRFQEKMHSQWQDRGTAMMNFLGLPLTDYFTLGKRPRHRPIQKLWVQVPGLIRASIAQKIVYKFEYEGVSDVIGNESQYVVCLLPHAVGRRRISLTLWTTTFSSSRCLTRSILKAAKRATCFAAAQYLSWGEIMEALTKPLHAHDIVKEPTAAVWPSVQLAEDAVGLPSSSMQVAFGSSVADKRHSSGWEPKWTAADFFKIVGDEAQSGLDLDIARATIANCFVDGQTEREGITEEDRHSLFIYRHKRLCWCFASCPIVIGRGTTSSEGFKALLVLCILSYSNWKGYHQQ